MVLLSVKEKEKYENLLLFWFCVLYFFGQTSSKVIQRKFFSSGTTQFFPPQKNSHGNFLLKCVCLKMHKSNSKLEHQTLLRGLTGTEACVTLPQVKLSLMKKNKKTTHKAETIQNNRRDHKATTWHYKTTLAMQITPFISHIDKFLTIFNYRCYINLSQYFVVLHIFNYF